MSKSGSDQFNVEDVENGEVEGKRAVDVLYGSAKASEMVSRQ